MTPTCAAQDIYSLRDYFHLSWLQGSLGHRVLQKQDGSLHVLLGSRHARYLPCSATYPGPRKRLSLRTRRLVVRLHGTGTPESSYSPTGKRSRSARRKTRKPSLTQHSEQVTTNHHRQAATKFLSLRPSVRSSENDGQESRSGQAPSNNTLAATGFQRTSRPKTSAPELTLCAVGLSVNIFCRQDGELKRQRPLGAQKVYRRCGSVSPFARMAATFRIAGRYRCTVCAAAAKSSPAISVGALRWTSRSGGIDAGRNSRPSCSGHFSNGSPSQRPRSGPPRRLKRSSSSCRPSRRIKFSRCLVSLSRISIPGGVNA